MNKKNILFTFLVILKFSLFGQENRNEHRILGNNSNQSPALIFSQPAIFTEYDSIYSWILDTVKQKLRLEAKTITSSNLYNAKDRILESNWIRYKDNGTSTKTRSVYTYAANDITVLAHKDQYWDGSNWISTNDISYTYDANNNPLSRTWFLGSFNGTVWSAGTAFHYTYNSKNKLISDIDFFKEYLPDDETIKEFGETLLVETVKNDKALVELINPFLENWEMERVAAIDLIMLKMAVTEILKLESIPTKVTLNEYVEISKMYSTDKSKEFINGILDRLINKLNNEKKIIKSGRGLID